MIAIFLLIFVSYGVGCALLDKKQRSIRVILKRRKIILTLPIFYYIIKWYDYSQKSFAFIYI